MNRSFGTSQRHKMHYSKKKIALLPLTASSWTRTSARCMGVWPSGHIAHTSPGVHATCSDEGCSNIASYIQNHVAPGTVVHSDQWRAYSQVASLPPVTAHHTVNHSINFIDPTTGVHTQHVESYWNRVKVKLKRMRGCHLRQLPGYLDEFMWRERHGKTGKEAFATITQNIAQQYPV